MKLHRRPQPSSGARQQTSAATSVLHHVRQTDVKRLEEIFSTLTPDGWVIPDWLKLLSQTVGYRR